MDTPDIDPNLLISTRNALKALNVRRKSLIDEITGIVLGSAHHVPGETLFRLGGVEVDPDAVGALLEERIGPSAVRLLLELHAQNALPTTRKRLAEVPDWLARYAAENEDALRLRSIQLRELGRPAAEEKKASREALLGAPEKIAESQFTWSLLNDLFWHHVGQASGALVIGGIAVHKHVTSYTSNRGKSRDFEVAFRWTGGDGRPRELVRESRFRRNRRNDPARDFGLPD